MLRKYGIKCNCFNCDGLALVQTRKDILQEYYKDWTNKPELHLELKYTVLFTYLDYYINQLNYKLDNLYLFHFILSKKPWDFSSDKLEDYVKFLSDRV